MSATSGGGGSVSEGSEAGESSQSTMSVGDSPSTSFQTRHSDNVTKITLSEDSPGFDLTGSKINLTYDERQQSDGVVNMAFDYEEGMGRSSGGGGGTGMSMSMGSEGGARGSGSGAGMTGGMISGGSTGGMSGGSAGGMGGGMSGGSVGGMSGGSAGGMGGGMSGGSVGGISGGMSAGSAGGMGGGMSGGSAGGMGGGMSGGSAGGMGGGMSGGTAGGMAGGLAGGLAGGIAGGMAGGMSGGGGGGGASAGAGGAERKDKVPEAVNLELVNMVPYSNGNGTSYGVPVNGIPGIPVKKDSEQADMSTPYDEYFVPVNEHKKYMRLLLYQRMKDGMRCVSNSDGFPLTEIWQCTCRSLHGVQKVQTLHIGIINKNLHNTRLLNGKAVTSCCNERQLHASAMSYGHIRRKRRIPLTDFSAIPSSNITEPEPVYTFEHRGEKLYVTKDKRRPTSWRRCLSWIVACTVISVVLIVAILAGTGVILSEDQNGVKEASVGRNFAGANFRPGISEKQINGSGGMYVPRSIESQLIVDNLDLDPALLDSNSSAYQQFAKNMEEQLKMILFDKEVLESAASDIGLRVVNVSRDPFKVNYRIGWNYKDGSSNSEEPIKMQDVKRKLIESLSKNQGYIDKYHIDGENIKVDNVVNVCQTNNGGCSHICYYNYITQLFTCTCPTHLVLDDTKKNCVEWTGSSEQDFSLVPDRTSHDSEHDFDMNYQQNVHHHLEGQKEGSPQPEPQPDMNDHSHDDHHNESEHDKHNIYDHDHSHHHHSQHDQEPAPEPEPTAEPGPEPTAEPAPEPGAGSSDDSGAHNKHWSHSNFYGHDSDGSEAAPEPSPEPDSDGFEPIPEPSPESDSDTSDKEGHHSKDHESVGEPTSDSSSGSNHFGFEHNHDASPEPTPEPGTSEDDESKTGRSDSNSRESNYQSTTHLEGHDGHSQDGHSQDSQSHDGHSQGGQRNDGQSHDEHSQDGQSQGSQSHDGHSQDGQRNDGQSHDEHSQDGQSQGSQSHDGHSQDSQSQDDHNQDGQSQSSQNQDGHSEIGQSHFGHSQDSQSHDDHNQDGQSQSSQNQDGHSEIGHSYSGHSQDSQSHDGQSQDNQSHDGHSQDNQSHDGHSHEINDSHHYMSPGVSIIQTEQEPSAEPTPEPGTDSKENTHGSGASVDHQGSEEPSAEPTPEPVPDSSDNEKSHSDGFSHHGSVDSSTEADSLLKSSGDSGSTVNIHGGPDQPTSESGSDSKKNGNLHSLPVAGNEYETKSEEPTPEPIPADQDGNEKQTHLGMEGHEPTGDHRQILETDPYSTSQLWETSSRPENVDKNEQTKSPTSEEGGMGGESLSASTLKPDDDSTSNDKTTISHNEAQPGGEGQIIDPSGNSALGGSIQQSQNTNSEITSESSGIKEQNPQVVEFNEHKEGEHPFGETQTTANNNMNSEDATGKTPSESGFDDKTQEQTKEPQFGVQNHNLSGQKLEGSTSSDEEQKSQGGIHGYHENEGSSTELTPAGVKEHEDSNKNESDGQTGKVETNTFHDYILGHGGHLRPESKEGEITTKGFGDQGATSKPEVAVGTDVNFGQNPTTLPPHVSMENLPAVESGSELEQILLNDSLSHPVHGKPESTDNRNNMSDFGTGNDNHHHVPFLQDILVKESSPSTIFNSPDAHNTSGVDSEKRGEAIVETVIVDKSSPQSTESPATQETVPGDRTLKSENGMGDLDNATSSSNTGTDKNLKENTTNIPGIESATGKENSEVTTNPSIIEYVANTDFKNNDGKKDSDLKTTQADKTSGVVEVTENPNVSYKGYEVTEHTSETDPSTEPAKPYLDIAGITHQPNSHFKSGEIPESDSKKPENEMEGTRTGPTGDDESFSKTTIRSEINRENTTIPITIKAGDFPSPYDGSSKTTGIFRGNPTLGTSETQSQDSDEDLNKSKFSSENVENGTKDSPTNFYQTGSDGSKTPQSGSTDRGTISELRGSEAGTTKNPEEFSNNIKDENEDFNTLIEEENLPGEGKEILLGKFANKFSKTDKKKLKDFDKKFGEGTTKSGVVPEEYSLQKHVNGNENAFDVDYNLPKEHTTVADVVSHGVPGVSFNQHGINNHDISILQTVTPDLKPETIPGDSRTKSSDSKEVEKDYSKFDKDYKYKDKGGKKKDLKKKIGGKDGKNVELDDNRKYFTDSSEEVKDFPDSTQTPTFERVGPVIFDNKDYEGLLPRGELEETATGAPDSYKTIGETQKAKGFDGTTIAQIDGGRGEGLEHGELQNRGPTGQFVEGRTSTANATSPGTVYDGQFHGNPNFGHPKQSSHNQTVTYVPGTVFDGVSHRTIPPPPFTQRIAHADGDEHNTTFIVYETTLPNGTVVVTNRSSTAHPTIIVRGQSGSLQDGHIIKSFDFGNGSVTSPENYQFTFSNGSAVHPTIVIRGQSGALQDGHESRFVNGTFGGANGNNFGGAHRVITNSTVYRIENGTLPGTVFDGHFNPQEGHYHMFTNESGTYVYSNATSQPTFVIKGSSGDFGNSKAYILGNHTRKGFNYTLPPTWFANGTGFVHEVREVSSHPQNETIKYTHQMTPTSFSSGTAYTVNNYFGYISKCAAGEFQCVNGTSKRGSACISLSSKCDSINDCSDGSDELGCIESGCPGNFQCSDGSCLKRHLVCNGIVDCSDGSDEQKCESWKCEFDEFQCPSGRCIPVVWQCDNKPDCDNHTDEYNCQTSCGNDEYLCPEGWCIPLTYKCNGIRECSNGEDEQLCDCSLDEFKCHTGGCVSKTDVCNGLDDCPDRSDEWGCVKLEPETNLIKIRTASGNYEPICSDNWTTQRSDEVCASLGFSSSAPLETENNASSATNEKSFFIVKSNTTEHSSKKFLVNLMRSNETCSSGKFVQISCQEFSCGSRSMTDSSSAEGRLVGGKTATAGQWPSVALLYNIRNLHSCTANVLTPRWVLASYNCLKMGNKNLNQQDWKMFGGSTVFETEKDTAETRNIISIIPHPQVKFNQFLFSNDLALVELDEPLYFSSNMGAVCLPEQEIQPRQICVTAGWGMSTPEDKAIRQQLQYLPVPTMNLTECNSTEHYSGFITEDKICAGYNAAEKSLCYNEEGAPLMCVNDRGEWELQGVLSYHSNCGRGSHPSIFSSITPVKEWIKQTIGNSFERKSTPVTKR